MGIRIFGSSPTVRIEPVKPYPGSDPVKTYPHARFEQTFRDTKKTVAGILADTADPDPADPVRGGIRINRISKQSALYTLGLRAGDFVRDENGTKIASVADLIEILQSIEKEEHGIRIERIRANSQMDPIYIEFH